MLLSIHEQITFRKLEILLVFLDAGSLGRAAERLGISPVSVHRALHALEEALQCSLFKQEGRLLAPTPAALALADVARVVTRQMADGIRITRELAGYAADRIRIGSLYSLTSGTIPMVIQGLKLRRPDIQTELVLGSNADLMRKLRDGSIDAGLMGEPDAAADLVTQPLFEDTIYFAARVDSAYASQSAVDLAQCHDERFVSLTDGFVTHSRFLQGCQVAGFVPKVVMTTGDIFTLINLVAGGMGCTLLPGRVRAALPREVVLVPLLPRYQMHQAICLCLLRARERDPNLLALLATCRGQAG